MSKISERLVLYASGIAALGLGDLSGVSVPSLVSFMTQWWDSNRKPNDTNSCFHNAIKILKDDIEQSPEFKNINWGVIKTIIDQLEKQDLSSQAIINLVAGSENHQAEAKKVSDYVTTNLIDWKGYSDKDQQIFTLTFKLAYQTVLSTPEFKQDRGYVFLREILANQREATELINQIKEILDRNEPFYLDRKPIDAVRQSNDYLAMTYFERGNDFVGREQEKQALHNFLNAKAPLLWWQISGKAGQGKSRLALDFIDQLNDGTWYAGFLSYEQLSTTEWQKITFKRPTLIVIDYIANTQKAKAFMKALNALLVMHAQTPIRNKVRFLLLEREGYNLNQSNAAGNTGLGNWLTPLMIKQQDKQYLIDHVYKEQPLELTELKREDMEKIIKSWRANHDKPELPAPALDQILNQLEGNNDRTRAWRPLFAILYASLGEQALNNMQASSIEEVLEAALNEEQTQSWNIDGSPLDQAIHLACLATMVGVLDLEQLYALDINRDLYFDDANQEEILRQAHCLLGRNLTHNPDHPDYHLFAREPDLIGEFLVIRYLNRLLNGLGRKAETFNTLIQDAWQYDYQLFPDFLIRLNQDFINHKVTKAIGRILPPEAIKSNINNWPEWVWVILGLSCIINQQQVLNETQKTNIIILASEIGNEEIIQIMLNKKAAPNQIHEETGVFPLLQAAQQGHKDCVETLLDNGANPNQVNKKTGTFPLLRAAQEGHKYCVELLLDKKADPNQVNKKSGLFPLLMAAQNGHKDCVKLLLDKKANPNQVNKETGTFPLLQAAQEGHKDCVELLLNEKADPNQIDEKDGLFPLLQAAQQGHTDCVKLLLDKDVDPNQVNKENGSFPLLQAAQQGHKDCVELLLNEKADPNQIDEKDGAFPLLQAAQQGHTDCVKLLLDKDVDPNQVNKEKGTFPLLMASQEGHKYCVELLLDNGANPNQVNKETGTFPLLMAAQDGHTDCVELLLDNGADPNQIYEKDGLFPLLQAAQNGHTDCVKLLLDNGANPNQVNKEKGRFPLLQAAQQGHKDCVETLLDNGANPNQVNKKTGTFPLLMASQEGHKYCVELLLDNGANPNQVNKKTGTFPLLMAAQDGHTDCVELLLDNGANPNQIHEKKGAFPLLQAAQEGHKYCVELLLDNGANPNQVNKEKGRFPLLQAAQEGHKYCVELLLDNGANPNQVNKEKGLFPLLQASQDGHTDCVKLLLDNGANPNQVNKEKGTFPLLMAAHNGHTDCVELLLDNGANPNQIHEKKGAFPLLVAVGNNHRNIVQLLLNNGAKLDIALPKFGTALVVAKEFGYQEIIDLLETALKNRS